MIDYQWDDNHDLLIKDGDFAKTESTAQHQYAIIASNQGIWRQSPEVGCGIADMVNDETFGSMLQNIRRQLEYDGQVVEKVAMANGKITVKADYPESANS